MGNHGRAPCGGGLPVHKVHGHRTLPPAGAGQGDRPRVPEGDGRGPEPGPREGADRPADVQEHPVEDGQGEGTDGGGAAARAEETAERLAEKAKAEAEAAGDAAPEAGSAWAFVRCLASKTLRPPTHPMTHRERRHAPQPPELRGKFSPLGCILDTHSKQWTILGQPGK